VIGGEIWGIVSRRNLVYRFQIAQMGTVHLHVCLFFFFFFFSLFINHFLLMPLVGRPQMTPKSLSLVHAFKSIKQVLAINYNNTSSYIIYHNSKDTIDIFISFDSCSFQTKQPGSMVVHFGQNCLFFFFFFFFFLLFKVQPQETIFFFLHVWCSCFITEKKV
jgi:hypothetical protein